MGQENGGKAAGQQSAGALARANLGVAIDTGRRFPENVFLGDWEAYWFFDSDWIFDEEFVERTKWLLTIEGGECACMADLEAPPARDDSQFLIEERITGQDFQLFLKGAGEGKGWVHSVGRFGCISDVGDWCIYCEKRNEIAVIALRSADGPRRYETALAGLNALPIEQALATRLSYGFSERALSPDWRDAYIGNYGARSNSG